MTRRTKGRGDPLPSHTVQPLGGLDPSELRKWAERSGQRFFRIDLAGCTDKRSVLREIARTFALPDWFGLNLDALYDSLTDLREQQPAAGFVVVLDYLPATRRFDVEQRTALLDVFRDVVENYAEANIPFRVLYRD